VPRPSTPRLAAQKKTVIAAERDAAARAAWRAEVAAWDPAALRFLDETSPHTGVTRLRAGAPRGKRAPGWRRATAGPT
jgi:hypothetical protein